MEDETCDLCEERFAPTKCFRCCRKTCDHCTFESVSNIIDHEIQKYCSQMKLVRSKLILEKNRNHDQEKQTIDFDKINVESTFEFHELQESILDEFQSNSKSIICKDCEDVFMFRVQNSIYGFNFKNRNDYLLSKTKFSTIVEAKQAHGSFEKFLANQAGFETVDLADKSYFDFIENQKIQRQEGRVMTAIMDITDMFKRMVSDIKSIEGVIPEHPAEYWFLKVIKQRLGNVFPGDKDIEALANEWELNKYFEQEHGQVYWTKRYKQNLEKRALNDLGQMLGTNATN